MMKIFERSRTLDMDDFKFQLKDDERAKLVNSIKKTLTEEQVQKFTSVMNDFKRNLIRTPELFGQVHELFADHPDLMVRFFSYVQEEPILGVPSDFVSKIDIISLPDLDCPPDMLNTIEFKVPEGPKITWQMKEFEQQFLNGQTSLDETAKKVRCLFNACNTLLLELRQYKLTLNKEILSYLSELARLKELAVMLSAESSPH